MVWTAVLISLLAIAQINTLECSPVTNLPRLYQRNNLHHSEKLSLNSMSRNTDNNKQIHNYIYQYPLELLSSGISNLNSILSTCFFTQLSMNFLLPLILNTSTLNWASSILPHPSFWPWSHRILCGSRSGFTFSWMTKHIAIICFLVSRPWTCLMVLIPFALQSGFHAGQPQSNIWLLLLVFKFIWLLILINMNFQLWKTHKIHTHWPSLSLSAPLTFLMGPPSAILPMIKAMRILPTRGLSNSMMEGGEIFTPLSPRI